eukprot:3515825-Lingulodinium_polyedra.AAC.1
MAASPPASPLTCWRCGSSEFTLMLVSTTAPPAPGLLASPSLACAVQGDQPTSSPSQSRQRHALYVDPAQRALVPGRPGPGRPGP